MLTPICGLHGLLLSCSKILLAGELRVVAVWCTLQDCRVLKVNAVPPSIFTPNCKQHPGQSSGLKHSYCCAHTPQRAANADIQSSMCSLAWVDGQHHVIWCYYVRTNASVYATPAQVPTWRTDSPWALPEPQCSPLLPQAAPGTAGSGIRCLYARLECSGDQHIYLSYIIA